MKVKLILRDGREVGEFPVDGKYDHLATGIRHNGTYFFQTTANQDLWPEVITYHEGVVWEI